MKAIAILSRDCSPMLPTLASAHEQGLIDFEANYWNGIFLPKGTPEPIVKKLPRCSRGDDRQPIGASTAERDRCDRRCSGATITGLFAKIRRE
jgi:hypothetical protein